jgi:hypothetical protein
MAFAIRNLSVLAYANGFTLWHYKAGKDSLATVATTDFFGNAADMLTVGDIVMTSSAEGARILTIASADAGGVETAALG